jgi:hypothetical protein
MIGSLTITQTKPTLIAKASIFQTGPPGPDGSPGPNSVTSATTSDGTADLSVSTITVGNAAAFNGATFTYGTGSASAHRTALGLGTGDSPTFAGVQVEESAQVKELIVRSPVNPGISILKLFASENQTPTIAASANILKLSRFASIRWTGASNNADGAADFAISRASNGVLRMTPQVLELTGTLSVTGASTFGDLIEQRNGTAAQESRIYGTYTDGSNYRRLALKMSTAGVAQIVAEGGGSGAAGNVLELPSNTTFADSSATRTALELGTGDTPTFAGLYLFNTGSGLSRPASNVLGFISGGAERARLDAAGGLVIGSTSNPTGRRLLVAGTITATGAAAFESTLAVTGASTLSGGATFGGTTEQAATRTALGGGATGQAIFQAATTSAAQTAAGFVTLTPAAYADLVATGTADPDTIYIVQE